MRRHSSPNYNPTASVAMATLDELATNPGGSDVNVTRALVSILASIKATNESIDAFFLSSMAILVYFMQCGFAFLEAGSVRGKSATNILMKNALDAFLGGLAYYAVGWALAYGEPGNWFCGTTNWLLIDMPDVRLSLWFFEYVFAASAATIVSGAMAERCNFTAYLVYSTVITGLVYPIVSHWVWSPNGWLAAGISLNNGTLTSQFHDFAGSGAVHATGGVASLIGAAILGARLHRFHPETGQPQPMPGHSVPLMALGAFILYFTFLAFNGGSQLSITKPGDGEALSVVMVNTILSCCSGGAMALILTRLAGPHWSLLETINGSLAGTVAVCSGCNAVYPWAACIIGAVGALAYSGLARLVLRLRVDDPASSVAVHLGGGAWGVLAVALLHRERGLLLRWDRQAGLDLAWQSVGLVAILGWSGGTALVVFGLLKRLNLLRAPQEFEIRGVDSSKHGEPAYPEGAHSLGHRDAGTVQESRSAQLPDGLSRRGQPQRRRFSSGMLYNENEIDEESSNGFDNPVVYSAANA